MLWYVYGTPNHQQVEVEAFFDLYPIKGVLHILPQN